MPSKGTLKRKYQFLEKNEMYKRFENKMPYAVWNKSILADYIYYGLKQVMVVRNVNDNTDNTNINNNVHYELICPPNIESEWYATECLPDANIRTLLSKITVPNIDLIRAKERSACDPLLIQCFNHNIVKVNDIEIDGLTHFVPQQRPDLIINMCNDFFSSTSASLSLSSSSSGTTSNNNGNDHSSTSQHRLIQRCMNNLIDNAIKYADKINVELTKNNNSLFIKIEDNGPGIPEKEYENVFKPFYKIDKGRADSKSSVGLGLSIASDIIRSHGGNIKLEKSNMKGLGVKIFLPV